MTGAEELIIGLAILAGIVGVVVPIIPGALLVLGAIFVWAVQVDSSPGWAALAIATVVILTAQVVKYVVPGKSLRDAGVPTRSLLLGTAIGVVGFFVVPVVGLFAGFVLGVYAAEYARLGREQAWPSTKLALRAVGLSILIELAACLLAAGAWLAVVVST